MAAERALMEWALDIARALAGGLFGGLELAPHRSLLLFVHLCAAIGWIGPAMGASWLVHVSAHQTRRHPDDAEAMRRDAWVRRYFNQVVALEHVAFAVLLVTGLMLGEAESWLRGGQAWLRWKVALMMLVFVPMEIIDLALTAWLQHADRRRASLPEGERGANAARAARWQDLFLRATIPPVTIGIPLTLYLAVVKPA